MIHYFKKGHESHDSFDSIDYNEPVQLWIGMVYSSLFVMGGSFDVASYKVIWWLMLWGAEHGGRDCLLNSTRQVRSLPSEH